jgi:hypothetical protein
VLLFLLIKSKFDDNGPSLMARLNGLEKRHMLYEWLKAEIIQDATSKQS